MSNGVNQVIIVGNLGRDVEMRQTSSGKYVATLAVAVNEGYAGKEHVEWFTVTAWDKQAEACHKYLSKGSQVYVQGRMRTESYEKDGQKKYITKVVAEVVRFLGGKPGARAGGPTKNADGEDPFGGDEIGF